MRNPRMTKKEMGLAKGALMRVFSRSDLRKEAIATSIIAYSDPKRPRVTKWSMCRSCLNPTPTYLMDVDHVEPKIPVDKSLEEMTWDQLVDNTWCDITNLQPICRPCHKIKSAVENKERRRVKNVKQGKGTKGTGKTNRKRVTTRSNASRAIQSTRKKQY